MELLLKEAIYRVHPNLIYVDVDSPQTTGDLLVTFRQAIARGKSLTGLSLTEREWQFLLNCTHERTDLLHCKTAIGLDKIPEKYRKLWQHSRDVLPRDCRNRGTVGGVGEDLSH